MFSWAPNNATHSRRQRRFSFVALSFQSGRLPTAQASDIFIPTLWFSGGSSCEEKKSREVIIKHWRSLLLQDTVEAAIVTARFRWRLKAGAVSRWKQLCSPLARPPLFASSFGKITVEVLSSRVESHPQLSNYFRFFQNCLESSTVQDRLARVRQQGEAVVQCVEL